MEPIMGYFAVIDDLRTYGVPLSKWSCVEHKLGWIR